MSDLAEISPTSAGQRRRRRRQQRSQDSEQPDESGGSANDEEPDHRSLMETVKINWQSQQADDNGPRPDVLADDRAESCGKAAQR